MTQISFAAQPEEFEVITQIVDRAVTLAAKHGVIYKRQDALMDMTACVANGCKLRLDELLQSGDGDFGHDVFGIRRYIDRETGKLTECFTPRFTRRA